LSEVVFHIDSIETDFIAFVQNNKNTGFSIEVNIEGQFVTLGIETGGIVDSAYLNEYLQSNSLEYWLLVNNKL
jgi:hypothetical protein